MWSVRREDLQEAVRILNLVGSKNGIPSSDFFKVEPLSGEAGVLSFATVANAVVEVEVTGIGKWPYSKPFYLERKTFTPFITFPTEIKNKNPFVFAKEEKLKVRYGRDAAEFLSQPVVNGYTFLPDGVRTNKLILTENTVDIMRCAATCAGSDLSQPDLACVYMKPISDQEMLLLATNKKVGFSAKVSTTTSMSEPFPFPLGMLDVLKADGVKSLRWEKQFVIAKFDSGIVWQPVSDIARKGFPADMVWKSIKAGMKDELIVFQTSAYKFAKVMEKLAYYLQGVRVEDWTLRLSGSTKSSTVEVCSELPQVKFRESIEADVTRTFKMDLPLFLIDSVMSYIGKEESKTPMRFGLEKDGSKSYLKWKSIEMILPAKAI